MTAPPQRIIPDSEECTLVLFDLRIPGIAGRLHRERAAWQEQSDFEGVDGDHFILIVRPGAALRESA
jgi:hypothetical protein